MPGRKYCACRRLHDREFSAIGSRKLLVWPSKPAFTAQCPLRSHWRRGRSRPARTPVQHLGCDLEWPRPALRFSPVRGARSSARRRRRGECGQARSQPPRSRGRAQELAQKALKQGAGRGGGAQGEQRCQSPGWRLDHHHLRPRWRCGGGEVPSGLR
jgi:hypothetical protein